MFYFQTFREGISFLNRTEARQLEEELSNGSLMRATERNLSNDEGDKIELICKNIRQQSDYDWTKVLSINYVPKLQSYINCLVPGTRRNSEYDFWHPWILRFLIVTGTRTQSSFYLTSGTLSFKFLSQALNTQVF